jgi:hypothetical protein
MVKTTTGREEAALEHDAHDELPRIQHPTLIIGAGQNAGLFEGIAAAPAA